MDYTIIDDFLPEDEFSELESLIENPNIDVYYQDSISVREGKDTWSPFLGYKIYDKNLPRSDVYYFVNELLISKLDIKSLIRSKVNCYLRTKKIVEHSLHVDFDFSHKGSILSLNTCNGFTILNDGTKIKSIRNRLLTFDPSKLHKSTSCTDSSARWNIIVNYF